MSTGELSETKGKVASSWATGNNWVMMQSSPVSTARGQPLHYREFILLFQLMQLLSHYRGVCVCMCVCLCVCTRTRVHVCVFKLAKCLWLHLSGNWTY